MFCFKLAITQFHDMIMLMILIFVITNISFILATILVFGIARTMKVQSEERQSAFLAGKIPTKAPDGIYKGSVKKLKTSWIGKAFNAKEHSGINNFNRNGKTISSYPFKTYTDKGIQDTQTNVIKIDYNLKSNPWWLRMILDEVVETEPHHFLGKVHLRIVPGLVFTLGYFNLEK